MMSVLCLLLTVAARPQGSAATIDASSLTVGPPIIVTELDLGPAWPTDGARLASLKKTGRTQYALVCANLIADLLLTQRDWLLARLQPDGVLVIAGVLDREFSQVQEAYEAAGWMLLTSRREREWRSGSFARAAATQGRRI